MLLFQDFTEKQIAHIKKNVQGCVAFMRVSGMPMTAKKLAGFGWKEQPNGMHGWFGNKLSGKEVMQVTCGQAKSRWFYR